MNIQKWNVHSYEIFLNGAEQGNSPFSMTSYDHTKGDRIEERIVKRGRKHEGAFSSKFATSADWLKKHKKKTKYNNRIRNAISAGAESLEEARGQKKELMDVIETFITKAPEYNSEALFAMQKYFEQLVEHHLKWYFEPAVEGDIYADLDTQHTGQYRRFEWKLFGESGQLRYFIIYEKGKIINMQMWGSKTKEQHFDWDSFDVHDFLLNIAELRAWE